MQLVHSHGDAEHRRTDGGHVGPPRNAGHSTRVNLRTKVLAFVQFGGPKGTVDSTTFELVLALHAPECGQWTEVDEHRVEVDAHVASLLGHSIPSDVEGHGRLLREWTALLLIAVLCPIASSLRLSSCHHNRERACHLYRLYPESSAGTSETLMSSASNT